MRVEWAPDPELERCGLCTPAGRLDTQGAEAFDAALAPQVNAAYPNLLLDLRQIDWLSSAGVGSLARLLRHVQDLGGRLAVCGCQPRVRTVLRICGLEAAFNICDTLAEARARLRALPSA
jgi:anti-anti-sigma factor